MSKKLPARTFHYHVVFLSIKALEDNQIYELYGWLEEGQFSVSKIFGLIAGLDFPLTKHDIITVIKKKEKKKTLLWRE